MGAFKIRKWFDESVWLNFWLKLGHTPTLTKTLIKQILPNATIIEAIDGQDAVAKFQQFEIDIIFMDVQMPIMNGYVATQRIREIQTKPIPIIALTAGTVVGEREKCLEVGMDDYASKPIIKDTLEMIIVKWVKV